MKKYLQVIIIMAFPYFFYLLFLFLNKSERKEALFHGNVLLEYAVILLFYALAMVCAIGTLAVMLLHKWDAIEALQVNMIVKILHLPMNLLSIAMILGCFATIFLSAFSVLFMALIGMTVVLSAFIGLGGVLRAYLEHKISLRAAVVNGVLQFCFFVDVASSIYLFIQARANKRSMLDENGSMVNH